MTIETFLSQLAEHCGVAASDVSVAVEKEEEYIRVILTVPADDSGLFIGYHGETLDSVQRMVRIIFQQEYPDHKIMVNVNEYREQREEKLREITQSVALRVLESGVPYTFNSFFPAHERFVIHSFLSSNEAFSGLESVSEGDGKDRKLTIRLKTE